MSDAKRQRRGRPGSVHVNVNGTIIGGQHVGGGSGLTNVDADLLDGINSTAFLQSIPVPLTLSGSNNAHIVRGENSSASSGAAGVYGWASASGSTNYGVFGLSAGATGAGVVGSGTASSGVSYGGFFQSQSTSGTGVFGSATSTTGTTYGGRFEVASSTGQAVSGTSSSTTGVNFGGHFTNNSSVGIGVKGVSTATAGDNYAGYFENNSSTGTALYANAKSAVHGQGRYAIYANANGNLGVALWARTTNSAAVVGENLTGPYGLYAYGGIGATGTKSFQIDHPLDPENKYLKHYCAEGPEALNIYCGNVTTNSQGKAWVELPDYYADINKEPRYQLTVIDDTEGPGFVQVKIGRKIKGNRFMIMTSAPNVGVSWEVKAKRNDRWVRKHGTPIEVEKEEHERGKYQHPDLYGQPEERGLNYRRNG